MWAVIENGFVLGYIVGVSLEEAMTEAVNGRTLVEMTIDNSPAGIGWRYDGQKFIKEGE